jgi:hypothetical protein
LLLVNHLALQVEIEAALAFTDGATGGLRRDQRTHEVHAGVHAHQPVPTFPVDAHVDPVANPDRAQIIGFQEMNNVVAIVGITSVHNGVVAPVNSQAAVVAGLAATERVKDGRRQTSTTSLVCVFW